MNIKKILKDKNLIKNVIITGWVRTIRHSKSVSFLELNDGSCLANLQIILDPQKISLNLINQITTGCSVKITGDIITSPNPKQPIELQAKDLILIGNAPEDYPLQKKRHSFEFLRTIPHLRIRSNTFGAVFRIRSILSYAIHKYFNENGYIYLHAPIITANDCEGAGQMFRVTTLDDNKQKNVTEDFFGKKTYLTVSGQLEAEYFAQGFTKVYTFGPTFRAENSNTARHAAEFWMIEPEMAFCDLAQNLKIAEEMIKYVTKYVLDNCQKDLEFFNQWIDKETLARLNQIVNSTYEIITYTQAIDILKKSDQKFEYPVNWGNDLQTEHERYICEEVYKKPVFVINYPKEIKAFYMRLNDDNKTVAAMDLLVPKVGEIIGGAQREEREDILLSRMKEFGLDSEDYKMYTDIRRYGSTPHSGFGLGFERLIMFITGMQNIRDVLPFPRTPKNIV